MTNTIALDSRSALLSFEECAIALGGSRRIVEAATKRGHLAVVRLGTRCVRIERRDLEQFSKRRQPSPPTPVPAASRLRYLLQCPAPAPSYSLYLNRDSTRGLPGSTAKH